MRETFKEWTNPDYLYDYTSRIVNRVMLHDCKFGYCLHSKRFRTIKTYDQNPKTPWRNTHVSDSKTKRKSTKVKNTDDKDNKNDPINQKNVYTCRFNFPFDFNGFKPHIDENNMLDSIESDIKDPDEPLNNAIVHGASYDLLEEDLLVLLRNHPNVNNHIIELLTLWGANCDQK